MPTLVSRKILKQLTKRVDGVTVLKSSDLSEWPYLTLLWVYLFCGKELFFLVLRQVLPVLFCMSVERIEVLEYCQKFEVEQSRFPDSTNTEPSRKLCFSLT